MNRLRLLVDDILFKSDNTMVQFIRYSFVGFVATVADMLVFHVLSNIIGINHIVANSISFICGLIINYVMSRKWVFNADTGYSVKEFVMFSFIGVIGLGISDLILYILIDLGIFVYIFRLDNMEFVKLVSKCIAVIVVLMWNFIARKKLVFGKTAQGS
jgi:Predicted membrane protein